MCTKLHIHGNFTFTPKYVPDSSRFRPYMFRVSIHCHILDEWCLSAPARIWFPCPILSQHLLFSCTIPFTAYDHFIILSLTRYSLLNQGKWNRIPKSKAYAISSKHLLFLATWTQYSCPVINLQHQSLAHYWTVSLDSLWLLFLRLGGFQRIPLLCCLSRHLPFQFSTTSLNILHLLSMTAIGHLIPHYQAAFPSRETFPQLQNVNYI